MSHHRGFGVFLAPGTMVHCGQNGYGSELLILAVRSLQHRLFVAVAAAVKAGELENLLVGGLPPRDGCEEHRSFPLRGACDKAIV